MTQIYRLIQECPTGMLGCLPSPLCLSQEDHPVREAEAVVHGVPLPQQVIEELRRQGIPLSWYNPGELHDAVIACSYDGQLIDDHHGAHFRDKLTLTKAESQRYFQEKYLRECEHAWDEEPCEQRAAG